MLHQNNNIDTQFFASWQKLNDIEKQSLLIVAENYVVNKNQDEVFLRDYNNDIDNALVEIEKGSYLSHEKVVEQILNKK